MKLSDIIKVVEGEVHTKGNMETEITGCYVSDLCSDVLANSKSGDIWVTQHTHGNIVAVAAIRDLSGVIIVGGKAIEAETLKKADSEEVLIISTKLSTFEVAGILYSLIGKERKG